MSADEAQSVTKKMQKGAFDFNDFLKQSQSVRAMGGMAGMMKLIPGARIVYRVLEVLSISFLTHFRHGGQGQRGVFVRS